jgi:multidrug efflux system membrane fusion protein
MPPVPVKVAPVHQKDTIVELKTFGHVEEYSTVEVKARITGYLTEIHFTEGQMVRKGDLLASIDPREPQVALKTAQASLQRDQAQLRNAEREADRQSKLLEKGIASQDIYEASTTAVETLKAAMLADQASIDKAQLQIEYCSIRSHRRLRRQPACQSRQHRQNRRYLGGHAQAGRSIYVSFPVQQQYLPTIRRIYAAGDLEAFARSHPKCPTNRSSADCRSSTTQSTLRI